MLKPVKEAFLKHDLYSFDIDRNVLYSAFTLDKVPEIKYRKIASKGNRFVYCDTDRKDAKHGWYADNGTGCFREGIGGFGRITDRWVQEHLTEPTPITGTKFRNEWDSHPELRNPDYKVDDEEE
jgi:hypothetical protein